MPELETDPTRILARGKTAADKYLDLTMHDFLSVKGLDDPVAVIRCIEQSLSPEGERAFGRSPIMEIAFALAREGFLSTEGKVLLENKTLREKPPVTGSQPGRQFLLNPFGPGTITDLVHEGRLFNVYRADLCGNDVCLKTPSPSARNADLFRSEFDSNTGSETFSSGTTGPASLQDLEVTGQTLAAVLSNMLLAEAQVIAWTSGAWNHAVLGMGVWDGLADIQDQDDPARRFSPVLVMPYHDGVLFSRLPAGEKRTLFPKMLPALWTALCQMYHGDLSEENIVVSPDRSKFHILDPGVLLTSALQRTADSSVLEELSDLSLFTTTPANYPLLPPFHSIDIGEEESGRHQEDPAALLPLLRILAGGGFGGPTMCIASMAQRTASGPDLTVPPRPRPFASDLNALGVMYYRILTGNDLFFTPEIGIERPAWVGRHPSFAVLSYTKNDILETYDRVVAALEGGFVARKLDLTRLSTRERRLADALVNLTVRDQRHLLSLVD